MRNRGALVTMIAMVTAGCVHSQEREDPKDIPFELYQDNQLGSGYSVTRVGYSMDGERLKIWLPAGTSDPGSPEQPVYEGTFAGGPKQFVANATLVVRDPEGSRSWITIQVRHVEPLRLVSSRRLRLVFRLCPALRPDPTRSVTTEVEASLMTIDGARAPYLRGTCSSVAAPAGPEDEE